MTIFNLILSLILYLISAYWKESKGSETGLKKLQSGKFTGFSSFVAYIISRYHARPIMASTLYISDIMAQKKEDNI